MLTNEAPRADPEDSTPSISPGNYSPVTVYMHDTLGAIFLGVLSGILLIGWIRAEARFRNFITQSEVANGNRSLNAR
jgi:hypothetical protein